MGFLYYFLNKVLLWTLCIELFIAFLILSQYFKKFQKKPNIKKLTHC